MRSKKSIRNLGNSNVTSALKFVCGEHISVCRICFSSTDDQNVSIRDTVVVVKQYCEETLIFSDLVRNHGISLEPLLPQTLCAKCASSIIDCYVFQKLCQYSNKTWKESLEMLKGSLSLPEILQPSIRSTCLIVNESSKVLTKCRKELKSKKAMYKHLKGLKRECQPDRKKIRKQVESICEECGKKFRSRDLLAKHMRTHQINPCHICNKVLSNIYNLRKHIEIHHFPKEIKCNECTKKFGTEKLLQVHKKYYHQVATCKLCSTQLPSKKALTVHLNNHDFNTCPKCKKKILNKTTFKRHLQSCGKERKPKYFCDICNKGYIQKSFVAMHLTMRHGFGKSVSCKWCGKKYDTKGRLKSHIVKHTRERNFSCNECGGRFVTRSALIYHIRLHTGERPYTCDMCDEKFLSSSRRMEHIKRIHIKPNYECDICHSKYINQSLLKKHKLNHKNSKRDKHKRKKVLKR